MSKESNKKLVIKARERFKLMRDADDTNRRDALDDMQFIHVPSGREDDRGGQWDYNMKKERGKRPCYVFNKLRVTMKRIINDIRANTPSAKVRGVEGGDPKTAEIFEGLIRNIWNRSDGDTIIDGAAQYMVSAGYGAWRIVTDYSTKTAFEQDIKVEEILNPFCLFSDPAAKDALKLKARDWILTEKIPVTEYEEKYPDAEKINFDDHEFDDDWDDNEEEEIRVAEYWYKEPTQKEIWQLQDGKVIEADTDEAQAIQEQSPEMIKNTRIVDTDKIMMCVLSGESILEGPTEWGGSMFPFIPVYGEHFVVDGEVYWYGAGRWAKDAQRSYNVSRTAITETIAQAPQAKFWATAKQAEGHDVKWKESHLKNFPFLVYNPDPQAPGPPQRMDASVIPIALIQESQIASEEINMTTGRYQNDVGAPNPASSGRQEIIRNQQGDMATYNYPDNMGKSIQRTWELLIDLIPQIYDTERELRVLGADGAEDYVKINTFAQGPEGPIKINDLSVGQYDTTVTIGASFSTKRQEAAETYQQLMQGNPEIWGVAGDLIFKSMDLPYADEISERLKTLLPPQIQQLMNSEQEIPPEVQAMMQQAEQAMAMVQEQSQLVQEQAQESEKAKHEVEKLIASLETKQANFEAKVATEMAKLAKAEAQLTINSVNQDSDGIIEASRQEAQANIAEFTQALAADTAQVLADIQKVATELAQHSIEVMDDMKPPRVTKVTSQRVNGKLEAIPEYEDG